MVNGFDGSSVIALGQVAYLKHECAPLLKVKYIIPVICCICN